MALKGTTDGWIHCMMYSVKVGSVVQKKECTVQTISISFAQCADWLCNVSWTASWPQLQQPTVSDDWAGIGSTRAIPEIPYNDIVAQHA
jgi:hypothetical protein